MLWLYSNVRLDDRPKVCGATEDWATGEVVLMSAGCQDRSSRYVALGLLSVLVWGVVAWGQQPPPVADKQQADDAVPLSSTIEVLNGVPITVGSETYRARIQYIPLASTNQVVLFPVWVVTEVQVEEGGRWRPLTRQDVLPVQGGERLPRLRVKVKNLLAVEGARDRIMERVRQETEKKNNMKNPAIVDPKVDEGNLRVRLFVYWDEQGKDWVISREGWLSKTALRDDRGSSAVVVLDGGQLGALKGAKLDWSDVQLEVLGPVHARLERQMVQAQFQVVQQQWVQLRNRLRPVGSSLGEPQMLVAVPLGGGQSQQMVLQRWLGQQLSGELRVREGEANEKHVQYLLEQLVGLAREEAKLGSLDDQQVVSVLLGQQVALTGTMGEIRKLARASGREREQQVEQLVKQYRDYQQGNKQTVGGSVGILGFSASGFAAEETNTRQVHNDEQMRKDLHRALDWLQEHFEGRVPTVVGIRLDQESVSQKLRQLEGQVSVSQFVTAWITHTWPALPLVLSKVESKGLAGLIEAAEEGKEVVLAGERYVLDKGLVVDKSLVIRGAGAERTVIVVRGGEYGLRFSGRCKWELQGVTVEYVGEEGANLVVVDSGAVVIRECRFVGAKRDAKDARGGVGVWLKGTVRAEVSKCVCRGNDLHGIQVSDQARADLIENRCEENKGAGIAYFHSSDGVIRKNECLGNGGDGIYVGGESQPTVEGNTCEGNKWSGIAFADKSGGVARNNTCRNNEEYGIVVFGESQPTVEGNTCEGNKGSGIAFFDKSGGVARKNTCRYNNGSDMYVADTANPKIE